MSRTLKPELASFLLELHDETMPMLQARGFVPTVLNAREGIATSTHAFTLDRPSVASILDDTIDGGKDHDVPIRIFDPAPEEELPVMLYFHGGGHVVGSVTIYDAILRNLATRTRHIVIAPEYRLAPENPYPADEIDVHTTYRGYEAVLARRGIRHAPGCVVAGDSAGGALAAALVRDIQEEDSRVRAAVLIYPSLDYTLQAPSLRELATGHLLEADTMAWYVDHYLRHGEDRRLASPLHGRFSDRMPRTLILTAGFCPLRDESYAYAAKMRAAGAHVELYEFETMIHSFLNLEKLCMAETHEAYRRIDEFLRR